MGNLKFDAKGLIPAVVQDAATGEVLMLGYMNEESLRLTLTSGEVWFYSRSRQELWHKGATSGNHIKVDSVWRDCDGDTLLVRGEPMGPVCHTGNRTCFFEQLARPETGS
jgi:phosphoribosyl-ATP pyrophosphohydrolase/phosphoribosyl-AMP cyclohydrolase